MAMALGAEIWSIVATWQYLEKDAVGKQLVRSAAKSRNLIQESQYQNFIIEIDKIGKMLNAYINTLGPKPTSHTPNT